MPRRTTNSSGASALKAAGSLAQELDRPARCLLLSHPRIRPYQAAICLGDTARPDRHVASGRVIGANSRPVSAGTLVGTVCGESVVARDVVDELHRSQSGRKEISGRVAAYRPADEGIP